MTDYLKILNESYAGVNACNCGELSKLEYLSDYIFNFTTCDSNPAELFAQKAIEVCEAITNRATFKYIEHEADYVWFLIMCNMPFFSSKIEWGGSIRGCWWYHHTISLESVSLYIDGEQQTKLILTADEWAEFNQALIEFTKG